jgi:hypothetical protein
MRLFRKMETEDVEHLLGIEFAYVDGTYQYDYLKGKEINDDQDIDRNKYRRSKYVSSYFPKHYPCVVLFEDDHDMIVWGPQVRTTIVLFVYQKDFEKNPARKRRIKNEAVKQETP